MEGATQDLQLLLQNTDAPSRIFWGRDWFKAIEIDESNPTRAFMLSFYMAEEYITVRGALDKFTPS